MKEDVASLGVECVVAHELVRLLHRNHTPDFWKKLSCGSDARFILIMSGIELLNLQGNLFCQSAHHD